MTINTALVWLTGVIAGGAAGSLVRATAGAGTTGLLYRPRRLATPRKGLRANAIELAVTGSDDACEITDSRKYFLKAPAGVGLP